MVSWTAICCYRTLVAFLRRIYIFTRPSLLRTKSNSTGSWFVSTSSTSTILSKHKAGPKLLTKCVVTRKLANSVDSFMIRFVAGIEHFVKFTKWFDLEAARWLANRVGYTKLHQASHQLAGTAYWLSSSSSFSENSWVSSLVLNKMFFWSSGVRYLQYFEHTQSLW